MNKKTVSTALVVTLLATNINFPTVVINAAQTGKATPSNAIASDSDWEEPDEIELYDDISLQLVDNEAPAIKSIRAEDVDKLPGILHFTVDIKEDGSGINNLCVRIESLDSERYVNKTYYFDAESYSGEYELEYDFDDVSLPDGDWQISAIVTDNNGNESSGFQTFSSAKFHLTGNTDFESPTINAVRVITDKITVPDDVVVEVDTEDLSGIKEISMTLLGEDEHGNQSRVSRSFTFDPKYPQETYKCSIPITKTCVSGTYKLEMITVSDGVNNWTDGTLKSEWTEQSCEVINYWRDDYTPPEVKSVSFDSVSARSPHTLKIFADVMEDGSGLASMALRLVNTSTNQSKWVSFPVNQNNGKSGKYEACADFADFDNTGKWVIDCIIVDDGVGNDNYYQESFGCEFELLESAKMTGIYVKTLPIKTSYAIGDKLNLDGLTIYGQYSDGTERKLTGYAVGKFDSSTVGEKEIVVTYDIFKTKFAVSVIASVDSDDAESDDDNKIKQPESKPVIPDPTPDVPKQEEKVNDTPSSNTTSSGSGGKSHSSGGSGGGGGSSFGSKRVAVQNAIHTYPTMTVTAPYIYNGEWERVGEKWKFVANGTEVTAAWVYLNEKWYLIGVDGYMITGWAQVNGVWYYFFQDGSMARNASFIGEKWYNFADNGAWLGE